MAKIVVIGAGVGGLTAAAELARAGLDVQVLEAHVYPGGCAGTFYLQGYRFDVGATLAGGFAVGAPLDLLAARFGIDWQVKFSPEALRVHFPDGSQVVRWTDRARWQAERLTYFGKSAEPFWHWQEDIANALWQLVTSLPSIPPQSIAQFARLTLASADWALQTKRSPTIFLDALSTVSHRLPHHEQLQQYIDAQLLISAQTTSKYANALYGAAALDLAHQGVGSLSGGMGTVPEKLADAVKRFRGRIKYRAEVTTVQPDDKRWQITTKQGQHYQADHVFFNLPPWNIAHLLGPHAPLKLRRLPANPNTGWGAFVIYAGVDASALPLEFGLHHQVIVREPFTEGNTLFLSLSPKWDKERAPTGKRALTISTHTALAPWWQIFQSNQSAYEKRKRVYLEKVLSGAERAIPDLRAALDIALPGTPITFQRFTHRASGWVGGFPQTNLWRARGPRLAPTLWIVGDSIFPGQSVPATAMGGLRAAQELLRQISPATALGSSNRTHMPPHQAIL